VRFLLDSFLFGDGRRMAWRWGASGTGGAAAVNPSRGESKGERMMLHSFFWENEEKREPMSRTVVLTRGTRDDAEDMRDEKAR
jgi:hypothetical protein